MKIAIVCPEHHPVPPIEGGAVENDIYQVAQRLTRDKIVICSIFRPALGVLHQQGHIQYQYYRQGLIGKILLSTYRLPFKNPRSSLYLLPYSLWHAWHLKKFRPDIIHIHDRPQFVKVFKYLHPKARIILHLHQLSAFEERNLWSHEFINQIDIFVGVSIFLANKIKTIFPDISLKTSHVYNGVVLDQFQPIWEIQAARRQMRERLNVGERHVFLYVGRLAKNKGVDVLVRAFNSIVKNFPQSNVILIICGAKGFSSSEVTPYMKQIFELAKESRGNIVFADYVPHEKIQEYYSAADVLVVPSQVEEGFGNVAIEGMASGLPVIVSGRGALPEIVRDGIDGIVVSECDEKGFYQAMLRYLRDKDYFVSMGHHGRHRVEESFTWEKVTKSVEGLYENVIA